MGLTITDDDIRALSAEERSRLARMLAELATEDITSGPLKDTHRGRFLRFVVIVCLLLAPWTVFLAVTLPPTATADQWGVTWTGFDVALVTVLALTGWAALKRRQFVAIGLVVWATLLACDAWFDVMLDWGSPGEPASLATALLVELPVSGLAFWASRNLWVRTFWTARLRYGVTEPVRRLWGVEIFSLREHHPEGTTGIALSRNPD
jgi:hypothetical protein